MPFSDYLPAALRVLIAKAFPAEPPPPHGTPVEESADELTADAIGVPNEIMPVADYPEDLAENEEPSESDDFGQLNTSLEEQQEQIDVLTQEIDVLKGESKSDETGDETPRQLLCKLQADIAAGASGNIKQAAMVGGVVTEFGPVILGFNAGGTAGVAGDVALLQQGDHTLPCFQVSRGAAVVDQAQVISRETAVAGVATTPPRSDGAPGVMCVRHDAAADAVDDTATLYQSIEAVKKTDGTRRGFRVKMKPAPSPSGAFAHLEADSDGVNVPLPAAGGLVNNGLGPEVNPGLNIYNSGDAVNARCGWAVGDFKLRYATGDIEDTPAGFWWLECDGGTFSAVDYPDLNTLLGGNTLPDTQRRFLMGCHPADGTFGLAANDGEGTVGNRTPTTHGHALTLDIADHDAADWAHVHGMTGVAADYGGANPTDVPSATVEVAEGTGTTVATGTHTHTGPSHQHSMLGTTDANAPEVLSPLAHDTTGSSVDDKTTWPSFYALGVYILAKKSA